MIIIQYRFYIIFLIKIYSLMLLILALIITDKSI